MNESAKGHFLRSADRTLRGQMGQTAILDWRTGHTGTWDQSRREYRGGTETRTQDFNVACLAHTITGNEIRFGAWGSAQVGDLIMAFDSRLDVDDYDDLRIIYRMIVYKPVPMSDIPTDSIAGVIGDTQMFRVLVCRSQGPQQGVI